MAVVSWMQAETASAATRPRSYTVTNTRPVRAPERGVRVIEEAGPGFIGRGLSEHPVHSSLIEVRVVNTTIWLDPERDYIRQGHYKIDENHSIPAAQRLARSLNARGAYTVRGADRFAMAHVQGFQHHMIRMKELFKHAPRLPVAPKTAPDKTDKQIAAVVTD